MTREKLRYRLLKPNPILESGLHPFELFTLTLGIVAGLPLLFDGPAEGGSTAALLGPTLLRVWGVMLSGGCIVALIGVIWTPLAAKRKLGRPTTGLLIEQVGLVSVGVGAVIYAVGIAVLPPTAPSARWVPFFLVLALGLAALWRAFQIQRWVHHVIIKRVPPPEES